MTFGDDNTHQQAINVLSQVQVSKDQMKLAVDSLVSSGTITPDVAQKMLQQIEGYSQEDIQKLQQDTIQHLKSPEGKKMMEDAQKAVEDPKNAEFVKKLNQQNSQLKDQLKSLDQK